MRRGGPVSRSRAAVSGFLGGADVGELAVDDVDHVDGTGGAIEGGGTGWKEGWRRSEAGDQGKSVACSTERRIWSDIDERVFVAGIDQWDGERQCADGNEPDQLLGDGRRDVQRVGRAV